MTGPIPAPVYSGSDVHAELYGVSVRRPLAERRQTSPTPTSYAGGLGHEHGVGVVRGSTSQATRSPTDLISVSNVAVEFTT